MDKSQLSSLSQFALATLSSMDVLVLNAGLFGMGELLNPDDSPNLDDFMQLHVLSNHFLCQKWQSSFKKGTHIFLFAVLFPMNHVSIVPLTAYRK